MKIMLLSYAPVPQQYHSFNDIGTTYKLEVLEGRLFGLWQKKVTTTVQVPYNCDVKAFFEPKLNVWMENK